jgi:drug/metabolite transporter (DMT)-like permease
MMVDPSLLTGILLAVLSAALFALSNIYNRRATRSVRAPAAVALTLTLNVLLLLPLLAGYSVLSGAVIAPPSAIGLYALSGMFGAYLGRLTLYLSIAQVGPSRASMTKNSSPVFVVLLAALVFGQWPTPGAGAGIALILAGLAYVGANGEERARRRAAPALGRGLLIAVGSALVFAVSDLFRAMALEVHSDVVQATIFALLGGWAAAVLSARGPLSTQLTALRSADRNLLSASLLMGIAQLTSFAAIALMFVPYVTAMIATAPLFTALFSRLMSHGDEPITLRLVAAMLTVIGGGVLIALFG